MNTGTRWLAALTLGSLTLTTLGLATGCGHSGAHKEKEEAAEPAGSAQAPASVTVTKVTVREVASTLEMTGSLLANERSEIAAQTAGLVLEPPADVGTRVEKGAVLVRLDGRAPGLRLSAASSAAKQARARLGLGEGAAKFDVETVPEVRMARENWELAKKDLERQQELFAGGGVAKAALDRAQTSEQNARAQLESARNGAQQAFAGIAGAEAQAGLAAKDLSDARVVAPFAGAVAERRISAGEYATPGRVLLVLVDDSKLRLRMDIPESDAARVTVGSAVSIVASAFPDRTFVGKVARVGVALDQASRTLPVEAELDNPKLELKPGFFVRASLSLGEAKRRAFFAPRAAVVDNNGAKRVFVRRGDKVEERLVTIGSADGALVELRGALAPDDELIVDGVNALADGARIELRK